MINFNRLSHGLSKSRSAYLGLLLGLLVFASACGQGDENWAGVSSSENADEIYVSYGNFIAQVLPNDGSQGWVYPEEDRGPQFFAAATVAGDTVLVGDYDGGVHAIDRATGERKWNYSQGGTSLLGFVEFGASPDRIIGSVIVIDNLVIVPDEEGVFALDLETGNRLDDWQLETKRAVWSKPVYIPATDGGDAALYITSLDHYIYSIDPTTAEVIWKTDLGGAIASSVVYDAQNDVLFAGTFASELSAIDPQDGEILATFETEGWAWAAPALFSDSGIDDQSTNTLYFGDLSGILYAVRYDVAEQAFVEVWRNQLTEEGKLRATPAVTDETIVIGSDDEKIYAVERATGNTLAWSDIEVGQKIVGDLVVVEANGKSAVVLAGDNGDELLVALDLENGTNLWDYKHEG